MGKWSFLQSDMTDNKAMFKMVNELSDTEIEKTYADLNIDPLRSFRLQLFYGSSGGGWCCIDNALHPDHQRVPVQYYCQSSEVESPARDAYLEKCFKRATIMAVNLGLRNLLINPDPLPTVVTPKRMRVFKSMDDREFADLVNSLTAIGQEFGSSQQLRARITDKLESAVVRNT